MTDAAKASMDRFWMATALAVIACLLIGFDGGGLANAALTAAAAEDQGLEAPSDALPEPVARGFERYALQGGYAAASEWVRGGPLAKDAETLLKTVELLKGIEAVYGPYEGHVLLSRKRISERVQSIVVELRYQKGPLYASFLCYEGSDGATVVAGKMNFSTDPPSA